MRLRNIFIAFALFASSASVYSQNNIVEKLHTRKTGEGEVTIIHDSIINSLIGNSQVKVVTRKDNNDANKAVSGQENQQNRVLNVTEQKTIKARGYRIQIYVGNNSRVARNEANSIAEKAREEFPELPVYTYFQPPRWLCRVGDFRSIEEADYVMRQIKAKGAFKEISIVKEQINIPIE